MMSFDNANNKSFPVQNVTDNVVDDDDDVIR